MDSTDVLPHPVVLAPEPIEADGSVSSGARHRRPSMGEVGVAVAAFVGFCVVVLTKRTALLEPDDSAYLASIVALTHGHLALTTAQYHQVTAELRAHWGTSILQWDHLPNGTWLSEKNPGYPFYAAPFQMVGMLRWAPLTAGALASISLFVAGRRWLGRWGGTWAVVLFLFSGIALAFAWRPTMPSSTDASMVAAGVGALLWTYLAVEAARRRRTVVGVLGFVALEVATSMRYTDIVVLLVAVVAVTTMARPARVPLRSLAWWALTLLISGVVIALFNTHFYGGATKTGYSNGEITFSISSIGPNLRIMPKLLVEAVPGLVLGLVALGWMAVRLVRSRSETVPPETSRRWRVDAVVGAWLGAGWLDIWGLYSAYTWTAQVGGGGHPGGSGARGSQFPGLPSTGGSIPHLPSGLHLPSGVANALALQRAGGGGDAIHLIRFYLPAIGLIALLGAWTLVQLPRWLSPVIVGAAVVAGVLSFHSLTSGSGFGAGGVPGGLPNGVPGGLGGGGLPSGGLPSGGLPSGGVPSGGIPAGVPGGGGFPGGPPAGSGPPFGGSPGGSPGGVSGGNPGGRPGGSSAGSPNR